MPSLYRSLPTPRLAGLVFILLFSRVSLSAKEVITGAQFKNATLNSIDVLSSHLTLLQAQAMYNHMLSNISYTIHFAPTNLYMSDSTVHEGSFVRSLLPLGFGLGTVDELGAFIGFQGDYVKVFDLKVKEVDEYTGEKIRGFSSEISQVMVFLGVAGLGFQFDAGLIGGIGFKLAQNDHFPIDEGKVVKDSSTLSEKPRYIYSLYHKSGVFLSGIFAIDSASGDQSLSDFRFNVQPLHSFLPEFYGLPFVDLLGRKTVSSFYSKHFVPGSSPADSLPETSRHFDFTLGSDNFYFKGLRPALTLQLHPSFSFSKMEAAYIKAWFNGGLVMGARSSYFSLGENSGVSFDSFISLGGEAGGLGFSYSYNSPENTTFIPLPGLHVFGLQFIYGARATAKPIIPFAIAIQKD